MLNLVVGLALFQAVVGIPNLLGLVIGLLLLALVVYITFLIIGMFKLPHPVDKIVTLVIGLVFLYVLLRYLGIM